MCKIKALQICMMYIRLIDHAKKYLRLNDLLSHKVISGTDDRLNKLQGMLSQQRNDKEIIIDLKQRLKEFVTQNETAVRDFKNYKVHVQGRSPARPCFF